MLSTMKEASTTYDRKKGIASQVPPATSPAASCIRPFQLSPVAQRNIVRKAVPNVQKLAS